MSKALVEICDLRKDFPIRSGLFGVKATLKAISGVSLSIQRGETLALVGESGSGKSTLGRCLLRLLSPSSGNIFYETKDISLLSKKEFRQYRRKMQIIFQDPYASLNPKLTIGAILEEPLIIHKLYRTTRERQLRVKELLSLVGLTEGCSEKYPHEFSGGQRQRVGIARALAVEPEFIVCDEPVSSLDVSIQAQIINLLKDLQEKFSLTYLFISHDLRVVEHISHRVAVMYFGKIVEIADSARFFQNPSHPYSRALLSAVPEPTPSARRERIILRGELPNASEPPSGCSFHPRCFLAEERCRKEEPQLEAFQSTPSHRVSCWVVNKSS